MCYHDIDVMNFSIYYYNFQTFRRAYFYTCQQNLANLSGKVYVEMQKRGGGGSNITRDAKFKAWLRVAWEGPVDQFWIFEILIN